jgi:hypothetical protein
VTDFFDNNRYSHDPRTQFIGWAVMFNGAWDYPADVRGYTWGWVHELHLRNWSLRYASAAMPRVANGLRFDRRLFRNRGDVIEGEYRYAVSKHPGTIRLLQYVNHANAGTYATAISQAEANGGIPVVTDTRRNGQRWHRPFDTVATELTVSGISGVHALYLARGGYDFLIGDGRLQYGPEYISETYYSARLFPGFFASFDLQHVSNPAYNQDRGPVWIPSIRLHVEFGKSTFTRRDKH